MTDPWSRQLLLTLVGCLLLWLFSLRTIPATGTSDPSLVDRLWSILPPIYIWHWALSAPSTSPRVLLMALLSTVWGVRLTYNFFVKGGFTGGEDHRWAEIRTWPGFKGGWEVFNLLFICLFQQLVILAFSTPAVAALQSDVPLNALDLFAAGLYLALVVGETVADAQMLEFQTEKYRRIDAGEALGPAYERGFLETGLWAHSRHPNYFCEVSMWWVFYLFSIAAGLPLVNWTIVGPIFLAALFLLPRASLDVTENLSSRKYKDYPSYQARVGRFFPLPPVPAGLEAPCLGDRLLMLWFSVGILITYLVDIEQVMVADPAAYGTSPEHTPIWPPTPCVHAIHWWGHLADKLVLARPLWFQTAIWLEVVVQAPYYLLALFAFSHRCNWIRTPSIIYSSVLLTIMPIVLAEQYFGEYRTDKPLLVTAVYSPYVIMPLVVLWRVWKVDVFGNVAASDDNDDDDNDDDDDDNDPDYAPPVADAGDEDEPVDYYYEHPIDDDEEEEDTDDDDDEEDEFALRRSVRLRTPRKL